jgi:hypothetical protein
MRLTITSTEHTATINGAECRVWEGVTDGGARCVLFVHRVAVHLDDDPAEFEALLIKRPLPPEWPAGLPVDDRGRVDLSPAQPGSPIV